MDGVKFRDPQRHHLLPRLEREVRACCEVRVERSGFGFSDQRVGVMDSGFGIRVSESGSGFTVWGPRLLIGFGIRNQSSRRGRRGFRVRGIGISDCGFFFLGFGGQESGIRD